MKVHTKLNDIHPVISRTVLTLPLERHSYLFWEHLVSLSPYSFLAPLKAQAPLFLPL